jgi:hypothetical protein
MVAAVASPRKWALEMAGVGVSVSRAGDNPRRLFDQMSHPVVAGARIGRKIDSILPVPSLSQLFKCSKLHLS